MLVVCDVDEERMRIAKELIDQKYGNTDCAMTKDFREVLARQDIDAVMISTPDHWHTLISVMALRAGKDVQCEKPTLTIDEGKILIETVRKHRTGLPDQHGGPLGSRVSPHGRTGAQRPHRQAAEDRGDPAQAAATSPAIRRRSRCRRSWITRCGSGRRRTRPTPRTACTSTSAGFGTTPAESSATGATHLFDTAQWANDTERSGPVEIEGTGTYWEGGLYNTVKDYDVTYRYANGVVMTCKPGNPSIKFIGTDGWVGNPGWRGPLEASTKEILNSVIGPDELHLYTNPEGEHHDFLKCVKSRKDPYFPVDIGHRVSTVCHLANIAIKLGRKLKWDPEEERFENDAEADAMRRVRPMRNPWTLG